MRYKNIAKRTEAIEVVTRLQDRLITFQKMIDALCSEGRQGLRNMEDGAMFDEILERGVGLEKEIGNLETAFKAHIEKLTGKQLQSELQTFDGQVLSRLGMEDIRV